MAKFIDFRLTWNVKDEIQARETSKGLPISSDEDQTGVNPDCDIRDLVDYESTDNIVQFCNTQDVPSVLEPLVDLGRSVSANLDSVFELMCKSRHSSIEVRAIT